MKWNEKANSQVSNNIFLALFQTPKYKTLVNFGWKNNKPPGFVLPNLWAQKLKLSKNMYMFNSAQIPSLTRN